MKIKIISLLFGLLLVASCSTGYKPAGSTGGYEELQLKENVWKVVFTGNGYTSKQRVEDFTLLRSAEITLKHGYNYFIVLKDEITVLNSYYTAPSLATTSHIGNNSYTNISEGQNYKNTMYQSKQIIKALKNKSDTKEEIVYEAKVIIKDLKNKYNLKD